MSLHGAGLTGLAGDPGSPVHACDPRAKVLGLLGVTVVAVSTPAAAWPVYVACAAALAGVAVVARVSVGAIWRRARVVLPLVLVAAVAIPFVHRGGTTWTVGPLHASSAGLAVLGETAAKATLGTTAAVLLAATTGYPAVLRALEALRVPRGLILIAACLYRYLFVLVDEVGRMRAARDARGYRAHGLRGAATVGRVVAALFLRSVARAERVHLAMLARGHGAAARPLEPLTFGRADVALLVALATAVVPIRLALVVAS